jgi:hypothetical protein
MKNKICLSLLTLSCALLFALPLSAQCPNGQSGMRQGGMRQGRNQQNYSQSQGTCPFAEQQRVSRGKKGKRRGGRNSKSLQSTPCAAAGGIGGRCSLTDTALSEEAKAELFFMIEEETLAGDLYAAFAEEFGGRVFLNIEGAERRHEGALREVLRLKYPDLTVGTGTVGKFENEDLQTLYDTLLAEGLVSYEAALRVGALVEETDIQDLKEAIAITADEGLVCIFENLLRGSENHLRGFSRQLAQLDATYTPQVITPEEYAAYLESSSSCMQGQGGQGNNAKRGKRGKGNKRGGKNGRGMGRR